MSELLRSYQMNSLERLYIDVDGVINVLRTRASMPYRVHCITSENGDFVYIRMDVLEVQRFFAYFDEVVWATSWVSFPPLLDRLEQDLGVVPGRFDRIDLDRETFRASPSHSSGKAEAVAAHYDADPKPSLWIDDDLGPLDKKMASTRQIVLHRPDPRKGAYPFFTGYGRV
jgi:hypothetical protein